MPEFDVTWSNHYEADTMEEAIEQALGDLALVVRKRMGPSIFVVYGERDDGKGVPYDIEFNEVV